MSSSEDKLISSINHYQDGLNRHMEKQNEIKLLYYIQKLEKLSIEVQHLEVTGVGRTVNSLRKQGGRVGDAAKNLVSKWKRIVLVNQRDQEEEEEQEEEDDVEEDEIDEEEPDLIVIDERLKEEVEDDCHETIKSPMPPPRSDVDNNTKSTTEEKRKKRDKNNDTASENNSNSEKREQENHSKSESKSKSSSHKQKERNDRREKDTKRRDKDHQSSTSSKSSSSAKHDKHVKSSSSSTPGETNSKHDSEKKKHKTDKHHHSQKNSTSSTADSNSSHNKSKSEHHKKDKKHYNGGSDSKSARKSEDKDKKKDNKNIEDDIGSGSFAEALGMYVPDAKKNKRKSSNVSGGNSDTPGPSKEKKHKPNIPELLREPVVENLDINISNLLPAITPNYRPLGNILPTNNGSKKVPNEFEQLSTIISTKSQRTKVYSGNKVHHQGEVTPLCTLCIRVLQDNVDALEMTGGVPFMILEPILEKCTANQLFSVEYYNPYLIEDTNKLWQLHCQSDFRGQNRKDMETWREMYLRCQEERDERLKALTENIKMSQDKSMPVRTTKLAYVDDVAKPPRHIARKQAKNGGFVRVSGGGGANAKVAMTPSARLSALAVAGEAGKLSVPNPGLRAMERSSHHSATSSAAAIKPKKAPLMAKTLSLLRNRYRR